MPSVTFYFITLLDWKSVVLFSFQLLLISKELFAPLRKPLMSIFSPLFEHMADFLLWILLWCQKCLRTQWTAAMNAWIDMQTSSLCSLSLRDLVHFREFWLLSLFWAQIITYSCDCVRMHHIWSICASAHVFAHSRFTFSAPPSVTMCIRGLACECVLFSLCVFHAQHCLPEMLSKSPQCDNWLPGVPVSLLLIIVMPCRENGLW